MEMDKINVYRMTHIENVPHVLQHGITHKRSQNANLNYITIGDVSLVDTRETKKVRVDNGDPWDLNAPCIILGNFIPFYFGVKMPMLYVMQLGGNFVEQATAPKDIVYLVCSLRHIILSKSVYYFSDGHGTDSFSTFYDSSRTDALPEILDWTAIKADYWGGHENLNIKRKKQAELGAAQIFAR
ncbi:MAG: DUF4433 domain-containing protein [Aquaticitalea sp.]